MLDVRTGVIEPAVAQAIASLAKTSVALAHDLEMEARLAALEAELMSAYIASAPGTTAAEAEAALPALLRRHRIAELDRRDAALVEAKRRIGAF